jgi:ubiquinone/menaquinone biosynthesis C-methylase UbiE
VALNSILNQFFKYLYNDFAGLYDIVANVVSLGMWNKWVNTALLDINASPILEIGHGPGHLLAEIFDSGRLAFGLDSSLRMSKFANALLEKKGIYGFVINGYAQFLPFPSGYFAHIIATFPSEYILDPNTWYEVHRVLQPSGSFVWLPAAWITRSDPLHRVAHSLFVVTHQVPSEEPQDFDPISLIPPNQNNVFDISHHYVHLSNSTVLTIKAIKRNL